MSVTMTVATTQEIVLPDWASRTQVAAGGYFLDVQAKSQDIQIDGMAVSNMNAGSTVMICYCKGSHVGKEAAPSMWTLAGQVEIKESVTPTTAFFSSPVFVPRYEATGFYVFCKQGGLLVRSSAQDEILVDHELVRLKAGRQIEKDHTTVYTRGYVSPMGSVLCHAASPTVIIPATESLSAVPLPRTLSAVPLPQTLSPVLLPRFVEPTPPPPAIDPGELSAITDRLSSLEEKVAVQERLLEESQQAQATQDERIVGLEQDFASRMAALDERMTQLALDVSKSQAEANSSFRSLQEETQTSLRAQLALQSQSLDELKQQVEETRNSVGQTKENGLLASPRISLGQPKDDLLSTRSSVQTKDDGVPASPLIQTREQRSAAIKESISGAIASAAAEKIKAAKDQLGTEKKASEEKKTSDAPASGSLTSVRSRTGSEATDVGGKKTSDLSARFSAGKTEKAEKPERTERTPSPIKSKPSPSASPGTARREVPADATKEDQKPATRSRTTPSVSSSLPDARKASPEQRTGSPVTGRPGGGSLTMPRVSTREAIGLGKDSVLNRSQSKDSTLNRSQSMTDALTRSQQRMAEIKGRHANKASPRQD